MAKMKLQVIQALALIVKGVYKAILNASVCSADGPLLELRLRNHVAGFHSNICFEIRPTHGTCCSI